MFKTELSLDYSPNTNPKIIRLFDTSSYCTEEKIENYLIEVLPVNKSAWITFHVAKNFSLTLNSSNLRYKKVSEDTGLIDLPDGIYEFKQSYKPNIHTRIHYYHLRVNELAGKIQDEKNDLINDVCKISREEYQKNRDELRNIEEYMLAAKWEVEECGSKKKGKEMYEFATKLLEKYTNECKC